MKEEDKEQNINPFGQRANTFPGENCSFIADAKTDNFNKISLHLWKWLGRVADYIIKKKSFRLMIKYEPEAEIVEVTFYEKTIADDLECRNLELKE